MSPNLVCQLFSSKSCIGKVAKILENRKPNRKTNITWHQSISEIWPSQHKGMKKLEKSRSTYTA